MTEIQAKAKGLFNQFFPERQIYHRSGGTVRYISVSPLQQALLAGTAVAAVVWCGYASFSVLTRGPELNARADAHNRDTARYQRWLQETRAREASAISLLEERTSAFDRATADLEQRHETLKVLLEALNSPDSIETAALRGNGAAVLVEASIDEAAPRMSRPAQIVTAQVEQTGYRARIDAIRAEQTAFLDQAEDLAVGRAERAQGILKLTGVAVGRISDGTDMGGPLLEVSALGLADSSDPEAIAFSQRVNQVAARLEEASYFESVLDQAPLGKPVGVPFRETSGYGIRRDPFNRRPAWHSGLDMAAYRRAPIVASGPGEVTFAGTKSGYGRVVEIDHGFGFKTRYGHLQSIAVSKGDDVTMGDLVGRMGSTGRSTGPHLHYEVWFQGKTYNPVNFLRAGKHVHEG